MGSNYHANGYTIFNNILSHNKIDLALSEISEVFTQQLDSIGQEAYVSPCLEDQLQVNTAILLQKDSQRFRSALKICARLNSVQMLTINDNVTKLLHDISVAMPALFTNAELNIISKSFDRPDWYNGLPTHQDWPAMQGSLDAVVVWIPLVDITPGKFPLEVIPTSHKKGLLPFKKEKGYAHTEPMCYDDESFVPLSVPKGSIVLMSSFLLHRTSYEGEDNTIRLACSARYDNAMEPSYIDRGYPTALRRYIDRDLIEENFPSEREMEAVY